jgi:hypothetical protein
MRYRFSVGVASDNVQLAGENSGRHVFDAVSDVRELARAAWTDQAAKSSPITNKVRPLRQIAPKKSAITTPDR